MALVKCPDCGNDVSSEASACVRCGRPIANYPPFDTKTPPVPKTVKDAAEPETHDQTPETVDGRPKFPILKDPYKLEFFPSVMIMLLAAVYAVSPFDLVPGGYLVSIFDDVLILSCAALNLYHSLIPEADESYNKTVKRVKLIFVLLSVSSIVIVAVALRITMIVLGK